MKKIITRVFVFVFLLVPAIAFAQLNADQVYMFCYFKGNGDGLHLAYSNDGYSWKALFNDSILLKPTVSKDKLMRDPCIIKGGDKMYHLVWTVSWNDRGIGYASSRDLIHWSEQKFIPVLMHEDSAKQLTGPYSNPGSPITGNYWAEGPTAIKINNAWIVYFDKYRDHQYGAVTSTDLIHWTDISDKIHFPKGVRHGTIFTISKEEFEKLLAQSKM